MSQPRRSARLAADSLQTSQVLVESDLTDLDGFSDDMSEDLAPFSDDVPLPPAPSYFVCGGHSLLLGHPPASFLQCCSSHTLAMHHRLGPRVFPVSDLPRLQRSVPYLCGLPPLSALVLRSPRGGSCKRVHDLLQPSICCIHLQCALLPSAHSLRLPGSVSPL